jgi:hypothetical protein
MPGRDDELVEIDQMVGMLMGDDERVDLRPGMAGGDEALADAGSAIDQDLDATRLGEMGRAGAAQADGRGAAAEEGEGELGRCHCCSPPPVCAWAQ